VVAAFKAENEPVLMAAAAVQAVVNAWTDTFLSAMAWADERAGKDTVHWLRTFPEAKDVGYKEVCQRNYNLFWRVSNDLHQSVSILWSPPPGGAPKRRLIKDPPHGRLQFDDMTHTVTFDGIPSSGLDPEAYKAFKAIMNANGEKVTHNRLANVPGLKGKRLDRVLKRLPPKLRRMIRTRPGSGTWGELPPSK
jgi:hypothetical protein